MNFEAIYERIYCFFPERINISDGKDFPETAGFYSANLSKIWNDAEDKTTNNAEGYFVWALYSVIHKHARESFNLGLSEIDIRTIEKKEINDKYLKVVEDAEEIERNNFCCEMMTSQFANKCNVHDSIYDCPDSILDKNKEGIEYKILIHDGGSSGIKINFCPWCGRKL